LFIDEILICGVWKYELHCPSKGKLLRTPKGNGFVLIIRTARSCSEVE
jgi:hypothetical protein